MFECFIIGFRHIQRFLFPWRASELMPTRKRVVRLPLGRPDLFPFHFDQFKHVNLQCPMIDVDEYLITYVCQRHEAQWSSLFRLSRGAQKLFSNASSQGNIAFAHLNSTRHTLRAPESSMFRWAVAFTKPQNISTLSDVVFPIDQFFSIDWHTLMALPSPGRFFLAVQA